jgi:protoheme IX farnesyltransferase
MTTLSAPSPLSSLLKQYYVLTKPRVNALILFCAVIGMLLAQPELPALGLVLLATLGIGLVAGAAAAVNCLVESHIDAKMARTSWRPLPSGTLTVTQVFVFSGVLGGLGLFVLFTWVNALTAWLTLATFVGYAIVYTLQILLYTLLLVATTLLPVAMGMASWIYMLSALGLGGWFSLLSYSLYRRYSEALAKKTFRYSINYLALLFAFLLADHYLLGT